MVEGQVEGWGVSEEEEEDLVISKLQVIQKISQGSYTRTNAIVAFMAI